MHGGARTGAQVVFLRSPHPYAWHSDDLLSCRQRGMGSAFLWKENLDHLEEVTLAMRNVIPLNIMPQNRLMDKRASWFYDTVCLCTILYIPLLKQLGCYIVSIWESIRLIRRKLLEGRDCINKGALGYKWTHSLLTAAYPKHAITCAPN